MSDVTKGHSTIIEVGDAATVDASAAWTKLGKVTEVTPLTLEGDEIDVSHMESADQWREFDPGWAEAGEIDVTLQYRADDNAAIYELFRVTRGYRITFADGSKWTAAGFIKTFGNEVEREGIVTTSVGIKLSGAPDFTAA